MSDIREVHDAVRTNLRRRRELARMPRAELIDYIVSIEDNLAALATRIDHAYRDEP
ncbi:hypothetical protein [Microbacterium sp. NPDC087592]|uniref:hypothetical protein n=1 Tax=Microbacterium sp. NPDC087592 TaxID=3364193 RepID=UPI003814D355